MTVDELYIYANNADIVITGFLLKNREALSVMDTDGQCYIAVNFDSIKSTADEKTKLAHEIGHCELGAFYNVFSACDLRRRHENRADKWAIKKLIPKDELEGAVKNGIIEIWQLADLFDVSEDIMRKAVSLYKYGNLYSV